MESWVNYDSPMCITDMAMSRTPVPETQGNGNGPRVRLRGTANMVQMCVFMDD